MKKTVFCKYILIIELMCVLATASSCSKLIEIPGNPPTKITETQQFADSATTMTAVAGVYSYPNNGGGGFTFNDGLLSWTSGLSSDELSATSSTALDFFNYSLTGLNSTVLKLWSNPYTGLYIVNTVLGQVSQSSTLSISFKKQIIAEMKVVRALYYFNLVNLFGEVPLVLTNDYATTSLLPRASVDEVYAQILKDLDEAQQDLPVSYPSAGRMRPNKHVAQAFLAKVYLYRQDWHAAAEAATMVIDNAGGLYQLEPNLGRVFLDGSVEAIWQLAAANSSNNVSVQDALNFIPYSSGIFPTYTLTSNLLHAFEDGDLRKQNWVGTAVVAGNADSYYPYKYKNRIINTESTEDFMIFRLAEQYLIRAEARIHLGDIAAAVDDLNVIRGRSRATVTAENPSPLPDLDETLSETAAMDAVMKERQTELFTEWGQRWFDLKRTGTADAVLGAGKTGWVPDASLYPVPQAQRDKNPYLTQNAGYQ
ncbi:SusD family protein [bacterium A37T11]|nr:SusD family protein [bacterium A37T11]